MAVDIYETRAMLRALRTEADTGRFILDTLFTNVETFDTEHVDIDIVKGDERLAPFVAPVVEGKLMEDQGFTTRSYKPAYVKPKYITTAAEIVRDRVAGEDIYSGDAPNRAEVRLAKQLADGENQVTRREEWMASQGLVSGKVSVVGDGMNMEIDFGMNPNHLITLTGTDLWSDAATSKPLSDLSDWADMISEDGQANADILILGIDAAAALMGNESFTKALDNRRITLGEIKPSQLAKGVTYLGEITTEGFSGSVYRYAGSYIDENGDRQYFIPKDRAVMTSTTADFRRNFGAIADLDAGLVSMPLFPKSWLENDPSSRVVLLQSAPLPAPHQIDAVVSAKVV